jgi:hypothetical protein
VESDIHISPTGRNARPPIELLGGPATQNPEFPCMLGTDHPFLRDSVSVHGSLHLGLFLSGLLSHFDQGGMDGDGGMDASVRGASLHMQKA